MSRSTAPSSHDGGQRPGGRRSTWRWVAAAAGLAGYAALSNWLMVHAAQQPWAVAALFGPLVGGLAAVGWARRQWATLAGSAALVALLGWIVAEGGVRDIQWMYFLQHGALHLALAGTFGLTLRPGSTALITMMGERVHRHFTPAMRAYTRALTAAWALYFVAMVVVSTVIFLFAPWPWWSAFCSVVTPLAAIALFGGEHVWRYRRHPEFERITMRTAFEAWQRSGDPQAR